MMLMMNKAKQFEESMLKEWTQDDFSNLLEANKHDYAYTCFDDIGEPEIGVHFSVFNLTTINKFDELVYAKKYDIKFTDVLTFWFKEIDEVQREYAEDENDYMNMIAEEIDTMIQTCIGLFRYAIYCEEYEYASYMEAVLDDIANGAPQKEYSFLAGYITQENK